MVLVYVWYCVHVIHVVLCIRGTMLCVLCSHCIVICVFIMCTLGVVLCVVLQTGYRCIYYVVHHVWVYVCDVHCVYMCT